MNVASQAVATAMRARRSIGLGLIEPACAVDAALQLGFDVRLLAVGSLEGLYKPGERPMIFVGAERPKGRRNFTCAHELGHHFLGHGQRLDELHKQSEEEARDPTEIAADTFAAAFLMPAMAVRSSILRRGWKPSKLTPIELYAIACELDVGYSTLVDRMALGLKLLTPTHRHQLRRVRPKQIRERILGVPAPFDLTVVDGLWAAPNVDLESGDLLLLRFESEPNHSAPLTLVERHREGFLFEATCAGTGPLQLGADRNVNVRVSRRGYHGLADYRHFEDAGD